MSRQPIRSYFQERIQQLWNFPKTNLPLVEGGRLFYRRNSGLQLQAPIFVRESLTSAPTLLIDPNAMWPDGKTSLAAFEPAPDARHLAYAYARGGADWQTIRIRNLVTSEDLDDEIHWMRFSGLSWTKDGKGFFYARYPEPPAGKVFEAALVGPRPCYHALGTPQTLDRLIYTNADNPSWFVGGVLTDDGRSLLVSTSKGCGQQQPALSQGPCRSAEAGARRRPPARSSKKTMRSCRLSAAAGGSVPSHRSRRAQSAHCHDRCSAIRLSHGRR